MPAYIPVHLDAHPSPKATPPSAMGKSALSMPFSSAVWAYHTMQCAPSRIKKVP